MLDSERFAAPVGMLGASYYEGGVGVMRMGGRSIFLSRD